jgi:pectate lyase
MVLLCIAGCADAPAPAFEGYGTVSLGGAGGDSYHVTSLADAGPGSLRDGIVNRSGPRTIVFDVGGTITLSSDITIRTPFLTIAGETAPHPGITIRQATPFDTLVVAATHDIVISHLRFWGNWVAGGPDYENGKSITIDGDTNPDHVSQKIIFDHLTVRGAPDGGPDIWGEVRDVTISWCFFFKNYQTMTVSHTTAPYQVRQRISMHHNVLAKSGERNPQIRADVRDFDHVNNIAYDWGWAQGNGYGTRIRQVSGEPKVNGNFVNNAYIPGAVSPSWGLVYGSQPGRDSEDGGPTGPAPPQGTVIGGTNLGSLWVSGNILPAGNQDHYSTTAAPIPVPSYAQVTTWPAAQLGGRVLPSVGMKYRDAEEQAILDEIGRATAWSPAVVVTSPNGGETWPVGSERTVRWSAANLDPAAVVRISLSDGVTLTPIATVPRTQTSYPWTVPNSPTNDAAILVESLVGGSPETADMSDGVFSVTSSPIGRGRKDEGAGEAGPGLGDLHPNRSSLGEFLFRENSDLEHIIIQAGRKGLCVHVGNAVSVVIIDIGNEDKRSRTVLPGHILPRRRTDTSSGGYHSHDT